MVTLRKIKDTLMRLEHGENYDDPVKHLEAAIDELDVAAGAMNTLCVSGRDNLDALLGCMLALDMILGKEEDNG